MQEIQYQCILLYVAFYFYQKLGIGTRYLHWRYTQSTPFVRSSLISHALSIRAFIRAVQGRQSYPPYSLHRDLLETPEDAHSSSLSPVYRFLRRPDASMYVHEPNHTSSLRLPFIQLSTSPRSHPCHRHRPTSPPPSPPPQPTQPP